MLFTRRLLFAILKMSLAGEIYSAVAQLVERLAVNEDVLGSSPSRGAE